MRARQTTLAFLLFTDLLVGQCGAADLKVVQQPAKGRPVLVRSVTVSRRPPEGEWLRLIQDMTVRGLVQGKVVELRVGGAQRDSIVSEVQQFEQALEVSLTNALRTAGFTTAEGQAVAGSDLRLEFRITDVQFRVKAQVYWDGAVREVRYGKVDGLSARVSLTDVSGEQMALLDVSGGPPLGAPVSEMAAVANKVATFVAKNWPPAGVTKPRR